MSKKCSTETENAIGRSSRISFFSVTDHKSHRDYIYTTCLLSCYCFIPALNAKGQNLRVRSLQVHF